MFPAAHEACVESRHKARKRKNRCSSSPDVGPPPEGYSSLSNFFNFSPHPMPCSCRQTGTKAPLSRTDCQVGKLQRYGSSGADCSPRKTFRGAVALRMKSLIPAHAVVHARARRKGRAAVALPLGMCQSSTWYEKDFRQFSLTRPPATRTGER
jgi:hypothetical protein